MHLHFTSDLHLCEERPESLQAFVDYLDGPARSADTLYLLGDLFEYWIGDDDGTPLNERVGRALRTLSEAGTRICFMAGNRDFLLGERFAARAGMALLDDPAVIDVDGQRIALSHGDLLCTDDIAYQQFREQVRTPGWQRNFLSRSLEERRHLVGQMRRQSADATRGKRMQIMDVNHDAVEELFRRLDYPPVLIHGHTHRPARHEHPIAGRRLVRWVLPDWRGASAPYLCWNGSGFEAVAFPSAQAHH